VSSDKNQLFKLESSILSCDAPCDDGPQCRQDEPGNEEYNDEPSSSVLCSDGTKYPDEPGSSVPCSDGTKYPDEPDSKNLVRQKQVCDISKLKRVTSIQHDPISEDPNEVCIANIIQYASYDPLGSKTNVHSH